MALVGFVAAEVDAAEKGPQLPEPLGVATAILAPNSTPEQVAAALATLKIPTTSDRPIIALVGFFPAPDDTEAEMNAKGTRTVYCRAKGVDLPLKDSEQRRMQANVNVYVQIPKVAAAADATAGTDDDDDDA